MFVIILSSLIARVYYFSYSENTDVTRLLQSPLQETFLGTDSLGRDLFVRILVGGFNSLLVGLCASILTVMLGGGLGLLAGWYGSISEKIILGIIHLMSSLPSFLVISFLGFWIFEKWMPTSFSGQSLALIIMISLTHWVSTARILRIRVKELKQQAFIEAAISLGATPKHIFWVHLIPHLRGLILLQFGQLIPICIIYESFVSFIGFGFQSPETSWGLLIQDGWKSLSQYPHLMIFPILFLFVTVFSLNLFLEKVVRSKKYIGKNLSY